MAPAVRVLVTGFGPFPGVGCNASAEVARALASSPGIELFTAIIPVEWDRARAVAREAIARTKPHAVLHLGVSKRATGFEIETRALNAARPKLDQAGGARLAGQLARGGPPVQPATLSPARLLSALRQGAFPAQLSRSAGHYLCNALYYWSLADARAGGPLVGFVHMPALGIEPPARACLTLDVAIAGARVSRSRGSLRRAMRKAEQRRRELGKGTAWIAGISWDLAEWRGLAEWRRFWGP